MRHVALALGAGLVLVACGKRGDPLPPLRRTPLAVTDLRIAQRGSELEISYAAPRAFTDGARLPVLDVELLRALGPGEFAKVAEREPRKTAPGERVTLTAPLPVPGTEVRFSAVAVSRGRSSAPAPVRSLTVQPPPPAPTGLSATSSAGGARLAWAPPDPLPLWSGTPPTPAPSPAPGPSPEPVLLPAPQPRSGGFNVYRRTKSTPYGPALTAAPVEAHLYLDTSAEAGASYCYVVRTAVASDPLVESEASEEACLDVKDVTPPEAPTGLAALAAEDGIEVSWSPSAEADIALYRVYRSEEGGVPQAVAEVEAPATSWKDKAALPGTRYKYHLTAVDRAGNESGRSLVAEGGRVMTRLAEDIIRI